MKKSSLALFATTLLSVGCIAPLASCSSGNEIMGRRDPIVEEQKEISLSFPVKGEEVNILKPNILKYIDAMHTQAKAIENDYVLHDFYITGEAGQNYGKEYSNDTDKVYIRDFYNPSINEESSKKVALVFDSKGFADNTTFSVSYGLKADLSDAKVIETTSSYVTVTNLLARQKYYWKVSAGGVDSSIESFTTPDGFRMITAPGINNIRDMGGRPVSGGKHIKQGLIFRGAEMVTETYGDHYANLNDTNKKVMREEIGIKYEIDFRGDEESGNLVNSPLYDENHTDIEYMRIPDMGAYDYFFNSSKMSAHKQLIKNMFLAFKNANNKHVYFHCWGGADRTGTAGFLLGGLLGMSYTDLIIDYELTSFSCNYRPHHINDAKKVYRWPSLIYKMKTYEKNSSTHETYYAPDKPIATIIEEILIDKFELTSQDIADIRANLLED